MRDEMLDELLKLSPGAYQGDEALDSGSFADGTANVPQPDSERFLLEASNDQYWAQNPLDMHGSRVAYPMGAERTLRQLPDHLLGRRPGDPPPQLPRLPLPGGGTTELSRPMSESERRDLAREVPDIWGDPAVGMHPWLDGQTGDPSTELLGPEGW